MRTSFLLLVLVLWMPGLPAKELHVDPLAGCDRAGSGTTTSPFRSLSHALGVARSGDVVVAAIGSFDARNGERFPLVLEPGVSLEGQGMRDTWILASAPWESAIRIRLEGGFAIPTRLAGLTVLGGMRGVSVELEGEGGVPPLVLSDLALEDAGQGLLIRDLPGSELLSGSIALDRCVLRGHWGAGLTLVSTRAELSVRAVNCAITDNGGEGILVSPLWIPASIRLDLLHATVARNAGAGLRIQGLPTGGRAGCWVANSILWGNLAGDLVGVHPGSVEHSLLGGGPALGRLGNRTGDPRFLSGRDWRIGHGSAAIGLGRGDLPGLPGRDLDGQARPVVRTPDAGADQVVVHTLIADERGARVYRPLHLRILSFPGASVVWMGSMGTFFPGFSFPGLTGALQLDFILGMQQFGAAVAGPDGVAQVAPRIFNSTAVVGLRIPIQAIGLFARPGGAIEGGWSNLVAPGLILP